MLTQQTINLDVDLGEFVLETSLSLADACDQVLRGRAGQPLSVQLAQRWARDGYRVPGTDVVLLLPTVWWAGSRRLMRAWAVAFEQARHELARTSEPRRQKRGGA